MQSFKDNAGRVWVVQIHVSAVKRVRAIVGLDLYSLVDDRFQGLAKLLSDPVSLVDVLYVLCKDEADRAGMRSPMRPTPSSRSSSIFSPTPARGRGSGR